MNDTLESEQTLESVHGTIQSYPPQQAPIIDEEEHIERLNIVNIDDEVYTPLKYGFWPRTRFSHDPPNISTNTRTPLQRSQEEDEDEMPYIGALDARPPPPYTVARDIRKGFFIFVRPAEGSPEPIWMGKVMEHPQMNPSLPNYQQIIVRWWTPNNAGKTTTDLYNGWNTIPEFPYKLDHKAKVPDPISSDSVLASWRQARVARFQSAPRDQIKFAMDNLRRIAHDERTQQH